LALFAQAKGGSSRGGDPEEPKGLGFLSFDFASQATPGPGPLQDHSSLGIGVGL